MGKTILEIVKGISESALYSANNKLILVKDKAQEVMEKLDEMGFNCDNKCFGLKPNQADALLVYYDPEEDSNKGYFVVSEDILKRAYAETEKMICLD